MQRAFKIFSGFWVIECRTTIPVIQKAASCLCWSCVALLAFPRMDYLVLWSNTEEPSLLWGQKSEKGREDTPQEPDACHHCLSLAKCKHRQLVPISGQLQADSAGFHVIHASGKGKTQGRKSVLWHCWLKPLLWCCCYLKDSVSTEWKTSECKAVILQYFWYRGQRCP